MGYKYKKDDVLYLPKADMFIKIQGVVSTSVHPSLIYKYTIFGDSVTYMLSTVWVDDPTYAILIKPNDLKKLCPGE